MLNQLVIENLSVDNIWDKFLLKEPAIGIELEYEQCMPIVQSLEYWRCEGDGSLRDSGLELISHPLTYDTVSNALNEAALLVEQFNPVATERCGLHVHVNMLPYTVGNLWSFVALYALLEPTIYNTYAINRIDSMFAVPLLHNTTLINMISKSVTNFRSHRNSKRIPLNNFTGMKYSALNLNSLAKFGTVEMRQPYCTVDFAAITSWVAFVVRLAEIGTSFRDPEEVIELYEGIELVGLQRRLFGDSYQVDTRLQELAEDAAHWICGYTEPTWQELSWEPPNMEAV